MIRVACREVTDEPHHHSRRVASCELPRGEPRARDRFGAEVYAELKRVRGWLQEHPASDQLFAYLRDEDPYRV